ncbi:ABC transporter substrate-binding protein [Phreatobacter oligotrophus]|jgi:NitT/TauT family transport system substrate-binding protein|uniref:NitT/TauT family transport system substrate-binding protein n=1 Tax=Phreatobacter oligotrophus TaxID=1122261 RepID=A0A2T4ZJ66_9HYPH|nr:ABC transporter substrate-binding protein [Phreatobacter oligotrophus]PTM62020.1 NitT/TauT family transport system substrate-binding protein [Phreatobacter oligotrophus]
MSQPSTLRRLLAGAALGLGLAVAGPAFAQTKVAIGISGWTGFAPLTLAKEAGIFARNGLDVTIRKIPQASRHLAIASGDIQCAATTVETWIVWNANGIATTQLFQLDKSYGADGMAVRNGINSIRDLRGKTVAASAPGTAPYFTLAWMLRENGLSIRDVTVVNMEPGPAAQAFVAGQNDAAMTYEPFLSSVRAAPQAGKIIATTLDYPMVMDTFGCTPAFIQANEAAVRALAKSYFEALEMIKTNQAEAYRIMGADVRQTAEQFGNSAQYLRWQDQAANKTFFAGEWRTFSEKAADLLLELGIIRTKPNFDTMVDTRFIQ